MEIPGFRLHPLKSPMQGHYAVSVSSNWRVTFRFDDGNKRTALYLLELLVRRSGYELIADDSQS